MDAFRYAITIRKGSDEPSHSSFLSFFLLLISDRLESGCLRPLAPLNGEMFLLWSGLLIQFRCKGPQFRLIGPAAVICRNRTWTQDPPVCQLIQGKKKNRIGRHWACPSISDYSLSHKIIIGKGTSFFIARYNQFRLLGTVRNGFGSPLDCELFF